MSKRRHHFDPLPGSWLVGPYGDDETYCIVPRPIGTEPPTSPDDAMSLSEAQAFNAAHAEMVSDEATRYLIDGHVSPDFMGRMGAMGFEDLVTLFNEGRAAEFLARLGAILDFERRVYEADAAHEATGDTDARKATIAALTEEWRAFRE